jgi:hypothetical protein
VLGAFGKCGRFCDFAIAEGFDYLEDLGPGGEGAGVLFLVFVNGHQELELLIGHLAFFSVSAVVASASAGAASAVKTKAPVNDAASAVNAASAITVISSLFEIKVACFHNSST